MGTDRTEFARRHRQEPRGVAVEYSLLELRELDAANDAAEALMELQRAELEAVQQEVR